MTEQTLFVAAAALLLAAVLALVLRPLWRAPATAEAPARREANLAILRDQLAELERERAEGLLAEPDFVQARSELQRRLLDEVVPEAADAAEADGVARSRGARAAALGLALAIPLAALAGYLLLGNPDALDPLRRQARVSPQQIEQMLARLETRLKSNPDDAKGWVMLARSYKALGRYAESAEAYGRGGALVDTDAALLADYAEVLARSSGRLDGKPAELIARALKIDADEPQALFLAGAAASEAKDFAAVAQHWGRLLKQMDPASEEGKSLAAAVAKAREIVAQHGGKAQAEAPAAAARAEAVSGTVSLVGKLAGEARPGDLLFVFARADDGSRMPLAVLRASVAELPLTFSLDDTQALPGGRKLSEFAMVTLEARVAKSGRAQTSSGDLYGSVKGVKPGSRGVELVIDQVQP